MVTSINRHRAGRHLGRWIIRWDCGCGVTEDPGSADTAFVAVVLDPPDEGGWRISSGPYDTLDEADRYVEARCPHT